MNTPRHTAIEPRFRTIDGLSVRLAESADPGRGVHALLLSPWPEILFAFEPTWARLAEHAHLVAVDLPGFGHSERRDALLSPRAMGEFVVSFAYGAGVTTTPPPPPPPGGPSPLMTMRTCWPGPRAPWRTDWR